MTQPDAQPPLIGLGVSGGIGAYKSVEVARLLQKRGYAVQVIMTRNARRFIGALTFEAITQRPVITGQWAAGMNADIEHIALATTMKALVVAPATANVIGKFANGLADDFLSALYLATRAPLVLAPAMNTVMWEHPAVRANLATLAARNTTLVEPGEGYLACGWVGKGRLAEPAEIVDVVERVVRARDADRSPGASAPGTFTRAEALVLREGIDTDVEHTLVGRRVLVTAGPTLEDLDPVRFLGNRSSGRMGFAVARDAMRRGAEVHLIAGPTTVEPPAVTTLTRVRTAAEMHAAVIDAATRADVVIMAAAVADYTPAGGAQGTKIEKSGAMTLQLERTVDILAALGDARGTNTRPVLVGFAAETGDPVTRASQKLQSKRVDLIVANDVSADGSGFDVATNQITLVDGAGTEPLPLTSKDAAASAILDRVERLLA